MYRRSDPRFRRALNEISQTFESANESAQANVYSFSHNYVSPCFDSFTGCLNACTAPCFPARDLRRRSQARSRGRAELSFDFYDDWEADGEDDGLLGWSNDEYDGLLGPQRTYGATTTQPARQRAMSYGARRADRRKSQARENDDPTVIPASSYWGFLGKLTGKVGGGKKLRYKPSAADLQEHPGAARAVPEGEPLLEEDEDEERTTRKQKRTRSGTQSSGNTTDSLSSRGDIFPSEDELDDAIPLDDEFAMVLERRTTNSGIDDTSSARKGKRPSAGSRHSASRHSTRTVSSMSSRNSRHLSRGYSSDSYTAPHIATAEEPKVIPSMAELRHEEERVQKEEEAVIAHRREAAQRLAAGQGLNGLQGGTHLTTEKKVQQSSSSDDEVPQETPGSEATTPFPAFNPPPMEDHGDQKDSTLKSSNHRHDVDDHFNPAQLPRLSQSPRDGTQ